MKKARAMLLCAFMLLGVFSVPAQAKVGDVIGQALNTDIIAYINHYAIPSYAVNGQSVIVAEDLRNFGFDVTWNQEDRTLSIWRNTATQPYQMNFNKQGAPNTKFADILATDIRVYAGGKQLTSYAMSGYTMIPMEELNVFGGVYWVANERAIKLWVDNLHIRSDKQNVPDGSHTVYSCKAITGAIISDAKPLIPVVEFWTKCPSCGDGNI